MKKLVASLFIIMIIGLSGCETMKGLGEDIQSAGKAISKSADK